MQQFVCVRMVRANGIDLSMFQFDYDLTFAAFFLNADGTIYGRFGSRSSQKEATKDISLEGFEKALAAALDLHRGYPANRTALIGKQSRPVTVKFPEDYPSLAKFKSSSVPETSIAKGCIHCHMIRDAERVTYRLA